MKIAIVTQYGVDLDTNANNRVVTDVMNFMQKQVRGD